VPQRPAPSAAMKPPTKPVAPDAELPARSILEVAA
jgi:hypothetical protein